MAVFLKGNELNSELEKLFELAKEKIIIISPYIKLHQRYADVLEPKKNIPSLEIIIVFGKNDNDMSRSMKEEDFNFFKSFPNIQIRYESRLHAKFYANEQASILTSMNLYSFSQDNNIEAGIKSQPKGLIGSNTVDNDAYEYFVETVINRSKKLFEKKPEFENKLLGLSKKYISSTIICDELSDFFSSKQKVEIKDMPIVESNSNLKYISTTVLAKHLSISSSKLLFSKLQALNWIEKDKDKWVLTSLGESKGAQIKVGQYGEYIAWPESISEELRVIT